MAGPGERLTQTASTANNHLGASVAVSNEAPLAASVSTATTVLPLPKPSLRASLKERECLFHGELDLSLVGAEVVVVSAVAPVPRAPVAVAGRPAVKAGTQPRVEVCQATVHGVCDRFVRTRRHLTS